MVHDYQLALVPGMVRAARPDLALLHFTHTPFCGPNSIRVLPTDIAVDLCRSMASVPSGFHTTRWAQAYQASARTMLGIEAPITAVVRDPARPRPRRARRRLRAARSRRVPPPSSTTSSATASSSCAPTGSIRRRTSCGASSPTTSCSRSTRSGASGSCSSRGSHRRASPWPSTSRTARRWSAPRRASTTGGHAATGSRS